MSLHARMHLSSLRVLGPSQPLAEVSFSSGGNLISGPSNTGKTYIFDAIWFVLGNGSFPEPIKESLAYTEVMLELVASDGQYFTIRRSLADGKKVWYKSSIRELDSSKSESGSWETFWGRLLDIKGIKIKRNRFGTTNKLSPKGLRHLFFVGELVIIEKRTPIHTAVPTDDTKNESAFRFLLTGKHDSDLEELPEEKVVQASHNSNRALLNLLIDQTTRDLTKAVDSLNLLMPEEVNVRDLILNHTRSLQALSHRRELILIRQNDTTTSMRETQQKIEYCKQLLTRFEILKKQYESDLARLAFISEGSTYASQFANVLCPTCGKPLSAATVDEQDLSAAAAIEVGKIRTNLTGLIETIHSLEADRDNLAANATTLRSVLTQIEHEIQTSTQKPLEEHLASLSRLTDIERLMATRDTLSSQVSVLRTTLESVDLNQEKDPQSYSSQIDFWDELKDLSGIVNDILSDWHYPEAATVQFDSKKMDFIIGGQPRSANGKGVRSVFNSAIYLGIMQFCLSRDLPHPGFLVLDSPLTAYKETKGEVAPESDQIPATVQEHFFRSIASGKYMGQIIIIDNKEPSEHLAGLHWESFGTAQRAGFFSVGK